MYITNAANNQKSLKNKKNHMNLILNQVKNKVFIQQIDEQRLCNNSCTSMKISSVDREHLKPFQKNIRSKKSVKPVPKKLETQSDDLSNNRRFGQVSELQSREQKVQANMRLIKKLSRRSSHLQIKLQELIKCSEMYPGRRDSKQAIMKNIQKVLKNQMGHKSHKTSIYKRNSRFSANINKQNQQSIDNQIKFNCLKKRPLKINKDFLLNIVPTKKQIKKDKQDQKQTIDQNQSFSEDEGKNYCRHELLLKKKLDRKRIIKILKKSKQACQQGNKKNNLSLDTIIQNQLAELSTRQMRNTGPIPTIKDEVEKNNNLSFIQIINKPLSYTRKQQELSLENQKVVDLHNFIQGGASYDQDYMGDYFCERDIVKFRNKFDVYDSIYQGVIKSIRAQKINPDSISKQNLKSAFYLHQGIQRSQTLEVKRKFKDAMKRIGMINLQSNL